jgi:hypothetical protein
MDYRNLCSICPRVEGPENTTYKRVPMETFSMNEIVYNVELKKERFWLLSYTHHKDEVCGTLS